MTIKNGRGRRFGQCYNSAMIALLPRGTVYVVIALLGIFIGVQYVPIYFNAMQFHDEARQVVRFASSSSRTVAQVKDDILAVADDWAVPVEEENIKVEVTVTRDGPIFNVEVYYVVPVNLRLYQHEIEFEWRMSGESFEE